jgi:hypothetical protein
MQAVKINERDRTHSGVVARHSSLQIASAIFALFPEASRVRRTVSAPYTVMITFSADDSRNVTKEMLS